MPLIDVRCEAGHETEAYRPLAMYPATPPCPTCGASTERYYPQPRTQWRPDPVIVYQAPDGSVRFPGDAQGLQAKTYEKQGYQRIEIQGAAQMRAFEKRMNRDEYSRSARRVEQQQQAREMRESAQRGDLRQQMQSFSRAGRELARAAMARNDGKPLMRAKESGFHSEVYSMDRSNREVSRDPQGRRRRD